MSNVLTPMDVYDGVGGLLAWSVSLMVRVRVVCLDMFWFLLLTLLRYVLTLK